MPATKKVRKPNPWLAHVKQVRAKNPGKKYRDILILAKSSYTKK